MTSHEEKLMQILRVILDGAYTCSQHETMEGTLGPALAELMSTTSPINKYVLLNLPLLQSQLYVYKATT